MRYEVFVNWLLIEDYMFRRPILLIVNFHSTVNLFI